MSRLCNMKWLVLLSLVLANLVRTPSPIVRVGSGLVRGLVSDDGKIHQYLGVPYATVDKSNRFQVSGSKILRTILISNTIIFIPHWAHTYVYILFCPCMCYYVMYIYNIIFVNCVIVTYWFWINYLPFFVCSLRLL